MIRYFLIFLFVATNTLFAYTDSDMDGVEDAQDRCPNTSFTDLVDINGCTKESLVSNQHYDIIIGGSYADFDYQTLEKTDIYSTDIQVDYYYNEFSLQLSTAYFTAKASSYTESGFYDTFFGGAYQFQPINDITLRFSAGVILPTYSTKLNNNNTDYISAINFSYTLSDINLFAGYSYLIVNDDDYSDKQTRVEYQNSSAYTIGLGYDLSSDLYMSISYNESSSMYKSVEDIKSTSVYAYYSFDEHWFSILSYNYGLSDSASQNYLTLRLGYYF